MVLHRNDQQTLLEFANKLIVQRLAEIQALLDGVKAETTTPADAWAQIREIMERT